VTAPDRLRLQVRSYGSRIASALPAVCLPGPVRAEASADRPLTKLTVGIAGCCAFPASGHATAAPLSSVMNFRRLMLSTGDFLPISAADRSTRSVRRMLSLPQGG
jgi:hypothetical protein